MKKALIFVVLLVITGVAASLWLIPRSSEIALINYKDKRFDEALAAYEQERERGIMTPEVVNTLVELYLQQGAVNKAIEVIEQHLEENPNDIAARRKLGTLYQYAQQPDDYLRNLEELNRLEPSSDILAELSSIYSYNRQPEKQAETLQKLIEVEEGSNPERYSDLAIILASEKKYSEAADALQELREKHPDIFRFSDTELLTSLLLDTNRADEAQKVALWWKEKEAAPSEVARLINLLHFKGSPALAAEVLERYGDEEILATAPLLEERILLLISTGKEEEAYALLKTLHMEGRLSAGLQNRLLFLAIARGDNALVNELSQNLDVASLDEAQALSLLEIAILRSDRDLRERIIETYDAPEKRASSPLIATILAYLQNDEEADAQMAALEKADLSTPQILQGARICYRNSSEDCTRRLLAQLPQPSELTDAEVAAVGNLYYDLKAYGKGHDFIETVAELRSSPVIDDVRVKFAAVRGDAATVEEWLVRRGMAATPRTLKDLYFESRRHGHHAQSARIAEILYEKEQTPDTRHYLASAYVSSGQYADAVALLRGASDLSPADESNYLVALTKLSKKNGEYRRELGSYAAAQLRGNLPYKRKMGLIYALIDAGQINIAMPYVRELALKNGGNWAWIYASELTRQGRHEEARQFWVKLANQPGISDKERRHVAYNLMAGGYSADAEPVFRRLAAGKGPKSKEVNELLYLWGPRLSAEQLDWLGERMAQSAPEDAFEWGDIIQRMAGTEEIVPFAEDRYPQTLQYAPVFDAYVQALAVGGQFESKSADLLRGVDEYGDPELLRIYARTARNYGYEKAAMAGYNALLDKSPDDTDALREAGMLAYANANYSLAERYLARYTQLGALNDDPPDAAANAAYYYADLLRRGGGAQAEADNYNKYVIQLIDKHGMESAQALSKKAQSLIRLGDAERGFAIFESATAYYPNNADLLADRINALIEAKRLREARVLLAEPLAQYNNIPAAPPSVPVPAHVMAEPRIQGTGAEALLRFDGSEEEMRQFAAILNAQPWVSYTAEGHKRLLVGAKPGYILQLEEDATGQPALIPIPLTADTQRKQQRLRFEMLAARADLEAGKVYAATKRLNDLIPEYPQNAQLLGFTANAENYGGNQDRARILLAQASDLAPHNEDIALLQRDVRRADAPNIKLDHEWVKREDSQQHITTLSAQVDASENLVLGFVGQRSNLRLSDSRTLTEIVSGPVNTTISEMELGEKFKENKERGELYGIYHRENGHRVKVSFYANDEDVGAGLAYEFLNPLGESGIGMEYRKPYWDLYTESVVFNTLRDRVSLWHTIKPDTQWSIYAEPGLNRYHYNLDSLEAEAESWSVNANITYRPIENMPYIYLAYGLDTEHFTSGNKRILLENNVQTGTGEFTTSFIDPLVPFRNRETHFVSLHTGYDFSRNTYASALLGYGYDRLQDFHGPLVEGRITHAFTEELDAQLRGSYGFSARTAEEDETRLGGYVRWRF